MGEEPLEKVLNELGAHIDSPRLDIKQNPLYERNGYAMLDTHYYGGIVKYKWVARNLAIHGVLCKKDVITVEVNIGEDLDDPVLCITDLLPYLAADKLSKPAAITIDGGDLDLTIGHMPL
jgi:aspartyl aminopeptidase